jgi:hypothetical protein
MFYGVRFILQNPKIYYYKINKTNNDTAENKPGHKRKPTLQSHSKQTKIIKEQTKERSAERSSKWQHFSSH